MQGVRTGDWIKALYNNPEKSDVIIEIEERKYYCHSLIINSSATLEKMIQWQRNKENQYQINIKLSDFPYSVDNFEYFLKYLYDHSLQDLSFDKIISINNTADYLLINNGINRCINEMELSFKKVILSFITNNNDKILILDQWFLSMTNQDDRLKFQEFLIDTEPYRNYITYPILYFILVNSLRYMYDRYKVFSYLTKSNTILTDEEISSLKEDFMSYSMKSLRWVNPLKRNDWKTTINIFSYDPEKGVGNVNLNCDNSELQIICEQPFDTYQLFIRIGGFDRIEITNQETKITIPPNALINPATNCIILHTIMIKKMT